MIDWEQEIEIKWNYKHWKWYVEKGYEFTNWGNSFKVMAKDLYPNSGVRIEYICDICGEKQKTPLYCYDKIKRDEYGDTCKKCSTKKTISALKECRVQKMFDKIESCAKSKGYTLISTKEEYKNQQSKIRFICPKHGKQNCTASHFVTGSGCMQCGHEKVGNANKLPVEEVIKRVESVNNNKLLNPEEYCGNSNRNLIIQCGCGNVFRGCVNEISKRYRCPKCSKAESLGELYIEQYLKNKNVQYIRQYKFNDCRDIRPLPFDFYLPNLNKCIEFDGIQHYKNIYGDDRLFKTQIHDKIKTEYCDNNNVDLIRIPYWKGHQINEILDKELKLCK